MTSCKANVGCRSGLCLRTAAILLLVAVAVEPAGAFTERVSESTSGGAAAGQSHSPSVSANGRYVAFVSSAPDLRNGFGCGAGIGPHVWVRDRSSAPGPGGTWSACSGTSSDRLREFSGFSPRLSTNGSFLARNLFVGSVDSHGQPTGPTHARIARERGRFLDFPASPSWGDQFWYTLSPVEPPQAPIDSLSITPSISDDGRWVLEGYGTQLGGGIGLDVINVLDCQAAHGVDADNNGVNGTLVCNGPAEQVNLGIAGAQPDGPSFHPTMSPDARFVVFWSSATNLVSGDGNSKTDVFLYDRVTATTERVSVKAAGGTDANGHSARPVVSSDGRFVAFHSDATDLVTGGDANGATDVFVRDRCKSNGANVPGCSATTELISVSSKNVKGNGASREPSISADGRFVAFHSVATNLVPNDANGFGDIFVRDRQIGATTRASVPDAGGEANAASLDGMISGDGSVVVFSSDATNLVAPGTDNNGALDVFAHGPCRNPGDACSDGDPCTGGDTCNAQRICAGTTVAGCDLSNSTEAFVGGSEKRCDGGVLEVATNRCILTAGDVTVSVPLNGPPYALPTPKSITVALIPPADCPFFSLQGSKRDILTCAALLPDGQTFTAGAPPVTLTFNWTNVPATTPANCFVGPELIPEANLQLFRNGAKITKETCGTHDTVKKCPVAAHTYPCRDEALCQTATCDPIGNKWTVSVKHFSDYVVTRGCDAAGFTKLRVRGLGVPGEGRFSFEGQLPGLELSGFDPVANGVEVVFSEPTGVAFDGLIPGGANWTVAKTGNRWVYRDRSASPLAGIRRIRIDARKAVPRFAVSAEQGTYDVTPAVEPELFMLDTQQCFLTSFPGPPPAPSCVQTGPVPGGRLTCR